MMNDETEGPNDEILATNDEITGLNDETAPRHHEKSPYKNSRGPESPAAPINYRPIILDGTTHSSNCSSVRRPDLIAASFRVEPSAWAVFAIFAAFS